MKKLKEEGENGINGNGPNTFLWAMGPEGLREELAQHTLKGKFLLDLAPCDAAGTSAVVPNMPASAPTAVHVLEESPSGATTDTSRPTNGISIEANPEMMGESKGYSSVTSGATRMSSSSIKVRALLAMSAMLLLKSFMQI